ncbi:type II toxin-antitoxin system RelE/ParE family toxin [Thermophilibacter sp. ET337]|uniref:type II toxin-antitoxin system RelE/ParE family toxin n=1 Tax=Thermophilibacter sp. ET337 TaxID=2973084 RepID=UPI0021AC5697|nr:type II toxin-antitoxin system RelE/ParE family toxin [Thermophilibacter sp. ET337]MCR8907493.1 type II toxin-antitoxin system RelE/ParE family toxin [Thermophilibacter sp. ET337]
MACDVTYTKAAERDKERIVAYLLYERESPRDAQRFLAELDRLVENLSRMPEMYPRAADGRAAEAGYRKAGFRSYVALYRIVGDVVEVDRVFHAKQDYARLL